MRYPLEHFAKQMSDQIWNPPGYSIGSYRILAFGAGITLVWAWSHPALAHFRPDLPCHSAVFDLAVFSWFDIGVNLGRWVGF